MSKDWIKEKIGILKEILKGIIYAWILEISSTFARLITTGFDKWVILGICGSILFAITFLIIYKKLDKLVKELK